MTRLRALLAAMPDILRIVEPIADEKLRADVFDRLIWAAIDDAEAAGQAPTEPLPRGAAGQVLVADATSPHGVSWGAPGTVYGATLTPAPVDPTANNLAPLDTHTYATGGPVNPPSSTPTWDEVNRQHRQ